MSFEMMHMMAKDMTHERRKTFWRELRDCVSVCVYVCLKMKLTWSMSRGWNLQLKVHSLQILYMCSAAKHLSGTVQNLDRK